MADNDEFTEREHKLMANAWQCFAEQPKIDFEKLAKLNGYTNPRSASNAWAQIRKKLNARAEKGGATDEDANGDGAATPKAAKATPKKRGKKAGDEDDEESTPAKKKGRKAKATSNKKNGAEDADSEASAPVKTEEVEGENGDDFLT